MAAERIILICIREICLYVSGILLFHAPCIACGGACHGKRLPLPGQGTNVVWSCMRQTPDSRAEVWYCVALRSRHLTIFGTEEHWRANVIGWERLSFRNAL